MKKIAILALALVMAVGGLGAGFAHWAGTLDISGTVEMQDICVGWYQVSIEDPYSAAGTNNDYVKDLVTGAISQADQDIGWAEASLKAGTEICTCDIPDIPLTDVVHYETIEITLHEIYPGYYVDYQVHYHNCGLPVRILSATVEADPQLGVVWSNGNFPFKMETCDWIGSSLEIWGLQPTDASSNDGVQPGQTYSFTVTLEYEQWQ